MIRDPRARECRRPAALEWRRGAGRGGLTRDRQPRGADPDLLRAALLVLATRRSGSACLRGVVAGERLPQRVVVRTRRRAVQVLPGTAARAAAHGRAAACPQRPPDSAGVRQGPAAPLRTSTCPEERPPGWPRGGPRATASPCCPAAPTRAGAAPAARPGAGGRTQHILPRDAREAAPAPQERSRVAAWQVRSVRVAPASRSISIPAKVCADEFGALSTSPPILHATRIGTLACRARRPSPTALPPVVVADVVTGARARQLPARHQPLPPWDRCTARLGPLRRRSRASCARRRRACAAPQLAPPELRAAARQVARGHPAHDDGRAAQRLCPRGRARGRGQLACRSRGAECGTGVGAGLWIPHTL